MIMLDTSIWIDYFKRNIDCQLVINKLLKDKKIIALDFIFGELLQGAKESEKPKIIEMWEILPKVNIPEIGFYAGKYSLENKLVNKGVGLIDCAIIYATIESNSLLWTLDKKIRNVLNEKYLYK